MYEPDQGVYIVHTCTYVGTSSGCMVHTFTYIRICIHRNQIGYNNYGSHMYVCRNQLRVYGSHMYVRTYVLT